MFLTTQNKITIPRCYDSHLHLMATGQVQSELNLASLKSADDIANLKILPEHFRENWLVGFGWNQNLWPGQNFPSRKVLDKIFPDHPVAFSRSDGHALWVNSIALKLAGIDKDIPGGVILREADGTPSGVLLDNAKIAVEKIIPPFSLLQKKQFTLSAIKYLNQQGFTHARDMSGDKELWGILSELESKKELSLYLDINFAFEESKNFESTLKEALYCKAQKTSEFLNVSGVKFYMDGALGSEGAWLSQNYCDRNTNGFSVYTDQELKYFISKCWTNDMPVAVHTIGDKAVDVVAQVALDLKISGIDGQINFEHGELIRPDTILKISKLNSRVHMQPCHWLSDRHWLKQKLAGLADHAFPWAALEQARVPMSFGSDTPIEPARVELNFQALQESAQHGIPGLCSNGLKYFSHPNSEFGQNCFTDFYQGKPVKVVFNGKEIFNV